MSKIIALTVMGRILNTACFGVDEAYTGVLTALGLPAAQVEALKGVTAETLKDFKPEDYVAPIKTGLRTNFLNDPEFLNEITPEKLSIEARKGFESRQYARFMNEFKEYATTSLGLDLSDLTSEEEKSLKKVAEKVTTKYAGKLGTPEALKTLQQELQKALGENNEFKTNYIPKTELETALQGQQGKTSDLVTSLMTKVELSSIEGGLVVSPSLIYDSVVNKIKELYTLKVEGTEILVMRKDNKDLKAVNTDGSDKTFSQVVNEVAVANKLVKEKKEETPLEESGKLKVTVNGNDIKLPGNIAAKVAANLKAEGSTK